MFLQNPLHFPISEAARSGPLQVALATTTIFVPAANTTKHDALQLGGAGVDWIFHNDIINIKMYSISIYT